MNQMTATSRASTAALVGITLLALFLRVWGITRQSLWVDEMFTLKYAALFGTLTWDSLRFNLHGPLHALLLHGWAQAFGWGEFSVRLPQALIGTATVPALFFAARRAFGGRLALTGALLLAVNPFHVWYSQEVRNYALLMLCAVGAVAALERLDARDRAAGALPLALAWIAGLLSNLSMAFHIVAGGLWGIVRFRRRTAALFGLILAGLLAVVALLPWEIEFFNRRLVESHALRLEPVPEQEKLRGEATAPLLGIPYVVYAFSVGFTLGPSLRELRDEPALQTVRSHAAAVGATAVVFGMLGLFGLAAWIRGGPRERLWLLMLIVPILLAYLAAARNIKVLNPRYASVALPAYLLLLAQGTQMLRRGRIGTLLLVGAIALSTVSLVQMQTQPRYWREDARSATRVLRAELAPGDLLVVAGTLEPVTRYYWPELLRETEIERHYLPYRVGPDVEAEARSLTEAVAGADRTFVLFYRDDFHDPEARWERFLQRRYGVARRWEFPGARIWRLDGRAER
ncbi:MAG: hypothetical protein GF346_11525 [Candidatus Eisenbacteria bacterium]|nr:hypothetical protein [Candidatus Latescibacterota bacterium]MBD3303066.1 hypothetical protein [Candidatus Eisenbacteria bacterium]